MRTFKTAFLNGKYLLRIHYLWASTFDFLREGAKVDPGENLTGALHSNFERGGCGGRG